MNGINGELKNKIYNHINIAVIKTVAANSNFVFNVLIKTVCLNRNISSGIFLEN